MNLGWFLGSGGALDFTAPGVKAKIRKLNKRNRKLNKRKRIDNSLAVHSLVHLRNLQPAAALSLKTIWYPAIMNMMNTAAAILPKFAR